MRPTRAEERAERGKVNLPDPNEEQREYARDRFERARENIWNLPGFTRRQTTITAEGTTWFPTATWVIQTIVTDDQAAIFLETVSKEGGQRIVLPTRVARTIFRHHDEIMKTRRSMRAKRGADTRARKATNK